MDQLLSCTCCGADVIYEDQENPLCFDCQDNQYATDRWAERDSMMSHDSELDSLSAYNDHENDLSQH